MKEWGSMLKKRKKQQNIDRGRLYPILDQIFIEYDKNFRKTFLFSEFQDNLALEEILQELKEAIGKEFVKISYVRKRFTLTNYAIRYLRNIYVEYNRYEINYKLCIISLFISILAMIVSLIISFITILEINNIYSKWILFIMFSVTTIFSISKLLKDFNF